MMMMTMMMRRRMLSIDYDDSSGGEGVDGQ
jgi:hypothetical protein